MSALLMAAGHRRTTSYQTPTSVQAAAANESNSTVAGTITATLGAGATAANLIVAVFVVRSGSAAPATPSGFTLVKSQESAGGSVYVYAKVAAGGETAVTVTFTGTLVAHLWVREWSGLSSTVEGTSGTNTPGTDTATTLTTGGIACTHPVALVAGVVQNGSPGTGGSTFTSEAMTAATTANIGGTAARTTKTASGTYATTATWTTARRAALALVAFRAKAA